MESLIFKKFNRKEYQMRKSGKWNFTLVELLIVVAIIAILASILLPALQQAIQRAKGTHCESNVKQVCLAQIQYAMDCDDTFWTQMDNSTNWCDYLRQGKYISEKIGNCEGKGAIGMFIFQQNTWYYDFDNVAKITGRGFNSRKTYGSLIYMKRIKSPSRVHYLAETRGSTTWWYHPRESITSPATAVGMDHGTAILGFIDGHVARYSEAGLAYHWSFKYYIKFGTLFDTGIGKTAEWNIR